MPNLRPNEPKLPADWRNPYAAYQKLLSVAKALKEPVNTWKLEYPSRGERLVGKGWRLSYTFSGQRYNVFIGSNGAASTQTLNELVKGFKSVLEGRRAAERHSSSNKPASREEKKDPIYDRAIISKQWSEWQVLIGKIRSTQDVRDLKEKHKFLYWFMHRKAGILDMTMHEYLGNHPHARYGWTDPPRTQDEYTRRQRSYEDMVRREESRKGNTW